MADYIGADRDQDGYYILRPKYSDLWKKYSYLIKSDLVINRITEYDLRSANTSALRRAEAIKASDLDRLEELPKKEREVAIGKMIRQKPEIRNIIQKEIRRAKRELFVTNGIQDDDVLAIKNDAVYIIGRRLRTTTFGPMEFRSKGSYAAYLYMDKLEYYYDRREHRVDISGVGDSILEHPDHIDGIRSFQAQVMEYLVMDRRDALRQYLIRFVEDYKSMKLPLCFYREMSNNNFFRTTYSFGDYGLNLDQVSEDDRKALNGIYNYTRYVLPMVQRFL